MARKKKHEEHENHERWLVSYADFITLLFAFFVVMYSISSINEGKYRVLSSTLVSAFSHPAKTLNPIQYGTPLRSPIIQHKVLKPSDKESSTRVGIDYQIMPSPGQMAQMDNIADLVKHDMKKLIKEGLVSVSKTNKGVEIAINSEILFASGAARLSKSAQTVLKHIAQILKPQNNHINVEGYTDNIPISTEQFPSNWELSAARSASVVHLFTDAGIQPQRLAAIGFGEYRPIASNADAKGRKKNRRVAIMVLNEPFEKTINLENGSGLSGDPALDVSNGFKGGKGSKINYNSVLNNKNDQNVELIVLPVAVKAESAPAKPVKIKPIVLGAPAESQTINGKADVSARRKNSNKKATSLPLNNLGKRPSLIQLRPTNVMPAP